MRRTDVIQNIINWRKASVYLEIGVLSGENYLEIKAKNKIGVDPILSISRKEKIKYYLKHILSNSNKFYQMTSDKFFEMDSNPLSKHGLDVAFIDGLHTYEQTLRDVQNCLKYLNEDGVIILHDCNPPSAAASHPANSYSHAKSLNIPGWNKAWCGDVWKTIVHLRSIRNDLNIFVLDVDIYGLGIISKGVPENILEYHVESIKKLSYEDLKKNRAKILNLKDPDYLFKFFKKV